MANLNEKTMVEQNKIQVLKANKIGNEIQYLNDNEAALFIYTLKMLVVKLPSLKCSCCDDDLKLEMIKKINQSYFHCIKLQDNCNKKSSSNIRTVNKLIPVIENHLNDVMDALIINYNELEPFFIFPLDKVFFEGNIIKIKHNFKK